MVANLPTLGEGSLFLSLREIFGFQGLRLFFFSSAETLDKREAH